MANGITFDKRDIVATKHDIELLCYDMKQMEYRITTRLGVMIVAGISILAAMRFFG